MRLSIYFIVIFLGALNPINAVAKETKLLPLQEYTAKNNLEDPAVTEYVLTRCSALYLSISKVLDNSENFNATGDGFLKLSAQLLEVIIQLKTEAGQKNANKQAIKAIDGIYNLYMEEAHANWMKSGVYFDGYLKDDIAICQIIMGAKP